jgi:hypothetical protein
MNKPLLSRALVVAAVVAVAGVANAETFDSPVNQAGEASTMTNGQPNMVTNNIGYPDGYGMLPAPVTGTTIIGVNPSLDTTVLGGPPSVTTETVTVYPSQVYVQPNASWGYYQVHPTLMQRDSFGSASATSPIPDRAGEASTIVNGVPNLLP